MQIKYPLYEMNEKRDIEQKIATGLYKLTKNETTRRAIWRVYSNINAADGSLINGYIWCNKCKKAFKYEKSNIYSHKCYMELRANKYNASILENSFEEFDTSTNSVDSSSLEGKVDNLLEKRGENNVDTKSPVWQWFDLSIEDSGYTAEGVISCLQCKMVIECNNKNGHPHKCLTEYGRKWSMALPNSYEIAEKIKSEIAKRISTGVYRLQMNRRPALRSSAWNIFALIVKKSGRFINGYYYCLKCKRIIKSSSKTNGLNCHKCFVEIRTQNAIEELESKLKSGIYTMRRKLSSDPIWNIFALIVKDGGNCTVKGMICCRYCKSVLKWNGMDDLNQHKCVESMHIRGIIGRTKETQFSVKINEGSVKRLCVETGEEEIVCRVKKPRANVKEDHTIILPNDSNFGSSSLLFSLSNEGEEFQNNVKDLSKDSHEIWSRFDYILMGDNCPVKGMVSCRLCKMVLNYDGITNIQLEQHKCFSTASKLTKTKNIIPARRKIPIPHIQKKSFVKKKYNTIINEDSQQSYSRESKQTSLQEFNDVHSKEAIDINEESRHFDVMSSTFNDCYSGNIKEEIDEIFCLESPNSMIDFKESQQRRINHQGEYENLVQEFKEIQSKETTEIKENKVSRHFNITRTTFNQIDETFCLDSPYSLNEEYKYNVIKKTLNISTEWVIDDLAPLIKLEAASFHRLINYWLHLGASYGENVDIENTLPNGRTVAKHIKQRAEMKKTEIRFKINEILKYSENLAISIDLCLEHIIKKQFLFATLHLMENNEIFDICLGVKSINFSQISATSIRNKLENLLSNFGLNNLKDLVFITEEDSDMMAAALDNCTRLKCSRKLFGKTLDTAIDRTGELSDLIKTCKVIKEHLKSTNQNNLTELYSETPVNSHYELFKLITQNWRKVNDILTVKKETLGITDASSATLQCLIKLCQRFEFIFKRLQKTQSSSLCFVIPSIQRLQMMCASNSKDFLEIKALKANLLKFIEEIWLTHISIWHKAACFLYPPAKHEQENHLNEIKDFCLKQMKLLTPISAANDSTNLSENVDSTANEADDMDFFFPNLFTSPDLQSTTASSAEEEINRYCREKIMIHKHFNVLQWWRNNSTKYPLLSRLALQVLSIPACTAKSKRILPVNKNMPIISMRNLENISVLNLLRQK